MQRILKSSFVVALGITAISACGSSSKASAPASSNATAPATAAATAPAVTASAGPTITISKDLRFSSRPVRAGATVTVRNDGAVEHTVSADTAAGSFDLTMEPGKTMTFTAPAQPGTYKFHCNIHTFMMGALEVT